MNEPIVVDPPDFNQNAAWLDHKQYVDDCGGLAHDDGSPNWRAAFGADPGVVACPECNEFYWSFGRAQRCAKCGFVYPTDWWPMFSWGAQAGRGVSVLLNSSRHTRRMDHPYYRFGFENPPDGDLYKAAFTIDWRAVLEPWPWPESAPKRTTRDGEG